MVLPSALLSVLLTALFPSVAAMASPEPLPMPINADYSRQLLPPVRATGDNLSKRTHKAPVKSASSTHKPIASSSSVAHRPGLPSSAVSGSASQFTAVPKSQKQRLPTRIVSTRHIHRSAAVGLSALYSQFGTQHDNIVSNSQTLNNMAAKSASVSNNDVAFQQQSAYQISSLHAAMLSVHGLFTDLAAQKGLANYDKSNQLETLLKEIVNANKDAMSSVYILVYNIPGLGPILGPIVYDIKCIVDDILDTTENATDAILNGLSPALQALSLAMGQSTCAFGIKIVGLCAL
ncbi:hypothetical protein BD410DRAFT_780955 [Rickenella mellea]|uniref:Uncharacterized protein n=1 Tax=Rickenella mellea TaxID=50990 RepID=A0A4Y7QM63_9AGAM|nr:hypothetical protein BD410DRAFT_780955 [Rickenella mellea]